MGRGKCLSDREKGKIDAYAQLNLTVTDISRRIRQSFQLLSITCKFKKDMEPITKEDKRNCQFGIDDGYVEQLVTLQSQVEH